MDRSLPPDGVVFANKPAGLGSAALVSRLKRELRCKKVGHTGTLDRFASGLMILVTGKATPLADYFLHQDKSYLATFQFGAFTETHDPEGEVTESRSSEQVRFYMEENRNRILDEIRRFEQCTLQTPPLYSALKKEGQRFSDRARSGEVELPAPRSVRIYDTSVAGFEPDRGRVMVRLSVSSGTYIRALARDLSVNLDFPLHLGALLRESVGPYSLTQEGIWTPDENMPEVRNLLEVLPHWPVREVESEADLDSIRNGRLVDVPLPDESHTDFFLRSVQGELLAWARGGPEGYEYRRVFLR